MVNPTQIKKRMLKEVATFKYGIGNTIPSDGGKYPVYGCNGIVGYTSKYNNEDTSIIGHIGSAGVVVWAEGKHYVTYNGTICKANDNIVDKHYLYYQLQFLKLENYLKGGQPFLSVSDFDKFYIYVPPLKEQKEIAHILCVFDKHMDNLTRLIEKKKAIRDGALEKLMNGKIRLDGFNGEWKEEILGNLLKYEQPQNYIVKSTKYSNEFKIPVLTAGHSFILGYTHENFGIKRASKENPILLFDDFTTSIQFADFPFKVKSSAMKLLTLNDERNNIYFMYNLLKRLSYEVETHERHWISQFAKYKVLIPNYEEQQAVAEVLTTMDDEIMLLEKELAKMKQIREGAMEELLMGRVYLTI